MGVAQKSYDEVIDLFSRGTTSAEVLTFRPSIETQERVRYLLAGNQNDELTTEEASELERVGEIEHQMQLVKVRAKLYVKGSL